MRRVSKRHSRSLISHKKKVRYPQRCFDCSPSPILLDVKTQIGNIKQKICF